MNEPPVNQPEESGCFYKLVKAFVVLIVIIIVLFGLVFGACFIFGRR